MARARPQLLAFNRGEVSKIALARIDLAKLSLAAASQVNWMPMVVGPMMLRPGLAYIGGVASDNPAELVDFQYSRSDTALIELTDSLMRVWINDALITRPGVSTAVSDPTMLGGGSWASTGTTAGCTSTVTGGAMTLTASARGGLSRQSQTLTVAGGDQNKEHALRITVTRGPVTVRVGSALGLADYVAQTVLDTGTHSLAFTPTGGIVGIQIDSTERQAKILTLVTIEASGTLTLPTPWGASALSSLRWTQSGDIIYVAQYGGQQYKIERRGTRPGARGWSVVAYRSSNGPFLNTASSSSVLVPSVCEGNGTLDSSLPFFTASHVGSLFRLFTPGQINRAVLGAGGAFTEAVRVTGVNTDRLMGAVVTGTFSGTIRVQRSLIGPDSGFVDYLSDTGPVSFSWDDSISAVGPPQVASLNNVVAWYRVGFKPGEYASGSATVVFGNVGAVGGGRYGICRVTGFTSPNQVAIEVLEPFSNTNPTTDWQEGTFSAALGWPSSVALQEGRLWWFGGTGFPIAGSQSNNYTGYASADRYGQGLGDAGAILEDFGEGPADRVNWALALSRLLLGREGSVASIRSSSFDTPLTPTDFAVKDCSQQPAARLGPIKAGKRGVFVTGGNKVYELFYSVQSSDYDDKDLTRFNVDVTAPGLVDTAKATQPDTTIFYPRSDGQVACLLYDPNDEVEAWWRLMTLGKFENVRVLPRAAGGDDLVYFVVNRTVNGVTRRFIEKLTQRSENAGGLLNLSLDSHVTYSGSPVPGITLAHLPNTVVSVWADGKALGTGTTDGTGVIQPLPDGVAHSNIVVGLAGAQVSETSDDADLTGMSGLSAYNGIPGEFFADQQPSGRMVRIGTLTPSGGAVTLPTGIKASSIVGFFGYMAPFMSAKLAYGAQGGSALTQTKKINRLGLVLYDAHPLALQMGQRFDRLDAMPQQVDGGDVDTAGGLWSEFDEPMVKIPGEWDTDARLCLLGQAPYPVKVGALVIDETTHG